jgi:hypothetical protein
LPRANMNKNLKNLKRFKTLPISVIENRVSGSFILKKLSSQNFAKFEEKRDSWHANKGTVPEHFLYKIIVY